MQVIGRGPLGQSQYRNARILTGAKAEWVGEIQIERHQCPPFLSAGFNHFGVHGGLHLLPDNGGNIMPFRCQQRDSALVKILVELELHACASKGMST